MARVLKFIHAETDNVSPFGRDVLESFPEEELPAPPSFEMLEEDDEVVEEEVQVDPEVIRQEIMAEARAEAEQKVQEAYQEGLERGQQAGQEAFTASLAQCEAALQSAGETILETHAAYLQSLEPQVIDLVKAIALKVLDVELKTNPEVLQQGVIRALKLLTDDHAVTLHLNPADLEAIRTHEVTLLESVPAIKRLHLVADESIEPGGCIARTETQEVDGRIDSIISQVLNGLTE